MLFRWIPTKLPSPFEHLALVLVIVMNAMAADVVAGEDAIVMPQRGICAHRGASRSHPENTIAAFQEAIRLGVQQIEVDVCLTSDQQLVLIHDATLDRTTNGSGQVSQLTLQEIKQLDAGSWKAPAFAGQRVPTLRETLAMMPQNIWLNVHIKGGSTLGAMVAAEIVRQNRTHQAFLAAKREAARAARRIAPNILICNMDRQNNNSQYVAETLAHGDQFIQLLSGLAAEEDMRRLKAASVRVNYCCTNDPQSLQRLYDAGVQFPLVDDVAAMMGAAEKLGVKPWKPIYLRQRDDSE